MEVEFEELDCLKLPPSIDFYSDSYYNSLIIRTVQCIVVNKPISVKRLNGLISECNKIIYDYDIKNKIINTKNKIILNVVSNLGMLYDDFTYYIVAKYIIFILSSKVE